MFKYNVENWFWFIDGDMAHVYSSALKRTVAISSKEYKAFLNSGYLPTHIKSMDELREVLKTQYPEGLPANDGDENYKRRGEIIGELELIDRKSIRPIRENDLERLQELEVSAQKLREELRNL